ncbi:carboxypeptidase-like regulatory domain-containing protein [uncultured Rubinisphaera sp.]|uniref:carboxypeptidase-like regulatory domain-containing protein n=1 Tax=uncultured Rubinisphaera sp. TaxID=1678686 RepID=UPI0030D809EA
MNQQTEGLSRLHKQLWRKPQPSESVARSTLYSRRLILLLVTILLIVALLMSLTEVLRQPRTHLFIFEDQIPDYSQLESVIAVKPLAYPAKPDSLFPELKPAPANTGEEKEKTPPPRCDTQAVNRLSDLIPTIERKRQKNGIQSRDIVLIYLRAQGISDGDDAVLLVHTGNPKSPLKRFSVSDILEELSFQTRATLVLIDYGSLETDPANGILLNQFNSSLQLALNNQKQDNLWVIASHDLFEKSYVSDLDQRSIFESVLSQGLAGWADLNQNGWVELQELLSYVEQKVQLRVGEESEHRLQQTVRFLKSHSSRGTEKWNQRIISSSLQKDSTEKEGTATSEKLPAQAGFVNPLLIPQLFATALQKNPVPEGPQSQKSASPAGETSNPPADKADPSTTLNEKTDKPPEAALETVDLNQTLKDCWKIYEQLLNASPSSVQSSLSMPVASYAPAAWKDLETLLVYATSISRRPGSANLTELNALLTEQVLSLKQFDATEPISGAVGIARRIDRAFPRQFINWPNPDSLILLTWLAESNHRPLQKPILQVVQDFDSALNSQTPDSMQKWLTAHPEFINSYQEVKLCDQLLSTGVEWLICQRIVQTTQSSIRCRLSRYIQSDYSQNLVSQADELFTFAKTQIRNTTISLNDSPILPSLEKAFGLYQQVLNFHRDMTIVENQLWVQVVDVTSTNFDQTTPVLTNEFQQDDQTLIQQLTVLASTYHFLINVKQANPELLFQHLAQLRNTTGFETMENIVSQEGFNLENIQNSSPKLVNQANTFLQTPAEGNEKSRMKREEETAASGVDLLTGDQLLDITSRPVQSWMPVQTQIQLAFSQAQLEIALWGAKTTEFEALNDISQQLGEHFKPLEDVEKSIRNLQEFQSKTISLSETFGIALAAFVRDFYSSSQSMQVEQTQSGSQLPRRLRALFCSLPTNNSLSSQTEIKNIAYLPLDVGIIANALRDRLLNPVEISYVQYSQLRSQADQIRPIVLGQAVWSNQIAEGLPVEVAQPLPIDLQSSPSSEFDLTISSNRDQIQKLWLTAEYESNEFLLEAAGPGVRKHAPMMPLTESNRLKTVSQIADYRPLSKYIDEIQTSQTPIELQPRGTQTFTFRMTRTQSQAKSCQCFFNVITNNRIIRYPIWVNCGQTSPIQLTWNSPQAIALPLETGWSLKMLPNSATDIELTASNSSETPQKLALSVVGLESLPANLPPVAVDASLAKQLEQQWGPAQVISTAVDYKVPALANDFPLLVSPAPGTPPAPPTEQKPVNPVLMAILHDTEKNLVSYIPIQTEILHPQDYVEPEINFDSISRSLTILLKRTNAGFPSSPRVRVEADLIAGGEESSAIQFPITLPAGRQQIEFETSFSEFNTSPLSINLTVDGYPRAFRYELPPNQTVRNLARSTKSQIQILSPIARTAYSSQANQILGGVQADLGFTSTSGNQTYIEFGIDINQDRVLYQEPSVKLNQDRLPLLNYVMTGTTLQLINVVQDLSIEVPLNNLTNQRVNLLGQVHTGEGEVWSEPVEIILDGQPPVISEISPLESAVVGMPLPVEVIATDGKLSGVESVSLVLDISRKGEITPDAALIEAQKNENGQWIAQVPTADAKPESYLLLAQATDRVGNVSQTARTIVKFFSAEEMKAREEAPNKTVRGQIIYGKDPVDEAVITLKDATGASAGEGKSDENGRFVLKNLKPGAYELSVRAVERGKIRTLSQPVELTPADPEVNLMLKLE